jgi:hypothetical protein
MEYWSDGSEGANKRFFSAFETQYSSTPLLHYNPAILLNYFTASDPYQYQ